MIPTGKTLQALLWWLVLLANAANAELNASLDRTQIALGDTFKLEISATADETLSDIDLAPLLEDFEVLQRATRSNVQIINGQRSQTRRLIIDLMARREGKLLIPPLQTSNGSTPALSVQVDPPARSPGDAEQVLFEAELDRDSVYVQGQLILTLRIQQAINLESRSVSELEIEGAFVKALEQQSYQRTIDGRPWLVNELRYAIFPERSGRLEIPSQTFSARQAQSRRDLFDRSTGRPLRRSTQPLSVEVLPKPAEFPRDATWLPARNLSIEESWSQPPDSLRSAESATRTLTIKAAGLQSAQLPPTLFPATDGLKYYPDQPRLTEQETSEGLQSERSDSAALVPTTGGTLHLPEIRVPWWDTEAGRLREAIIPARTIRVEAAVDPGQTQAQASAPALMSGEVSAQAQAPAGPKQDSRLRLWQAIALISSIGWLLSVLWWLRARRRPTLAQEPTRMSTEEAHPREGNAFKQLQAACAANAAPQARHATLAWATSLLGHSAAIRKETLAALENSTALVDALDELDRHLYAPSESAWQGERLASAARQFRVDCKQSRRNSSLGNPSNGNELALYPGRG